MAASEREPRLGRRPRPRAGLEVRALVRHRLARHRARAPRPGPAPDPRRSAHRSDPDGARSRWRAARACPAFATSSTTLPLDPSTLPPVLDRALEACRQALPGDHPACSRARARSSRTLRRLPRRTARERVGARPPARAERVVAGPAARARGPGARGRARRCARPPPASAAGTAAATGSADCSTRRSIAWCTGAARRGRSTTAGSSTSNDLVALHMEDPEVFAQTHALVARVASARVGGRIPDRPPRRPAGSARLLPASGRGRRSRISPRRRRLRREDPEPRRASAARVAGRRHHRLRLPQSGGGVVHRSRWVGRRSRRTIAASIRQPLEFPAIARRGKRLVLETGLSAGVRRLADRLLKLAGPAHPAARGAATGSPPRGRRDHRRAAGLPHLRRRPLAGARSRGSATAGGRPGGGAEPAVGAAPRRSICWRVRCSPGKGRWLARSGALPPALRPALPAAQRARRPPRGSRIPPSTPMRRFSPVTRWAAGPRPRWSARRRTSTPRTRSAPSAGRRACSPSRTHDTKRSADVRARLDVLSEIPAEWAEAAPGLAPAQHARTRPRSRGRQRARSRHRPPSLPGHGRHLAAGAARRGRPRPAAGAAVRLHGEGGHGRRSSAPAGPTPIRSSKQALRADVEAPAAIRCARPASSMSWSGSSRRIARAGLLERARPHGAAPRLARRPRPVPGRRAVEPVAGGSRQPAPGGFRAARAAAGGGGARRGRR